MGFFEHRDKVEASILQTLNNLGVAPFDWVNVDHVHVSLGGAGIVSIYEVDDFYAYRFGFWTRDVCRTEPAMAAQTWDELLLALVTRIRVVSADARRQATLLAALLEPKP
jgi:hypothetical protein